MGRRGLGVTVFLLALNLGCSDGEDLCARLAGNDFRSEGLISSILGPEGVEPTNEFLEFSESEAIWYYSDIGEIGEWECHNNRLVLLDGRFEADLIDEDGRLVLNRNGIRYVEEQ